MRRILVLAIVIATLLGWLGRDIRRSVPMSYRILVIVVVGVLSLSACSSSDDTATDVPTTDAVATTAATPSPSATSESSLTTLSLSTTQPVKDVVVYVAMGDSSAFTPASPDGLIYRYAEMLADHFVAEVDLRNRAVGSLHSTTMLEELRTSEGLRADLGEADVVTSDIPINVWVESLKTVTGLQGRDPADCGGDDGQQCLRDALDQYKDDTDAIIVEIVAICDPDEVLIRIYDVYMINTVLMLETGTLDVINPYWKAGNDYVEESAARYGIPVAQVYDAFMGPEGTDDPYLKGLLDEDQMHPNAEGAAVMADLLNQFGY
jgi:hypothetical protein